MYRCGPKDIYPTKRGGKADAVEQAEGNSTGGVSTTKGAGLRATPKGVEEPPYPKVRASLQGTTVVVGTGHAFKGEAQELVRANHLPARKSNRKSRGTG